ncbi:MAG: carbonic anhydrase [Lachnospiraceae bacterium]|nr:carbonic anhydrase [Lachnospiraceae bacterium]
MNYKNIIKSRSTRIKLLRLLSFVPDQAMLKFQYRIYLGRKLNLKNPQRFTEKIQWYKLNYKNPELISCVDKYEVRKYLSDRGFSEILTEDYGVYDNAEQIDFESLPESFVLKDTLGGGGNAVIIVKNKADADWNALKVRMNDWCSTPTKKDNGREWPYYSGKNHRIFIEEYLDEPEGLNDYKFFCFNGRTEFIYFVSERKLGVNGKFHILDRNFNDTGVIRVGDEPGETVLKRPEHYDEMLRTAEKLAVPFPHVRVDLYEYKGEIRFGELTFYNASGYMRYEPDSFDYEVGEKFVLPEIRGGV